MEKKNTILLTVIAVATLLVAVVGATFAYFTASGSVSGDDSSSTGNINTAQTATIGLTQTDLTGENEDVIYPGTMIAVGLSLAPTKTGGTDTNQEYTISYTVSGSVALMDSTGATPTAFKYPVKWSLYQVSASEDTPVDCDPVVPTNDGGQTTYKQTCTKAASFTGDTEGAGTLVKTGTIEAGTTTASINHSTTIDTDDAPTYYYLVVEYPNKETSQNDDRNKVITASLKQATISNTAPVAGA